MSSRPIYNHHLFLLLLPNVNTSDLSSLRNTLLLTVSRKSMFFLDCHSPHPSHRHQIAHTKHRSSPARICNRMDHVRDLVGEYTLLYSSALFGSLYCSFHTRCPFCFIPLCRNPHIVLSNPQVAAPAHRSAAAASICPMDRLRQTI